ncbi:MAG: hypothetical protein JNL58_22015 [Planctomyces sp.]|nr:hypothetical protein [Planctomyces sp.]
MKHFNSPDSLTTRNENWLQHAWQSIRRHWLWIAAILVWLAFVAGFYFLGGAWSRTGVFGDSFGVFNALVSALAATAAFKAFKSQQQQVDEQKREFLLQRKEQHLFTLMQEWRAAIREVTYRPVNPLGSGSGDDPKAATLSGQHALCQIENDLLGAIDQSSSDRAMTVATIGFFVGRRRMLLHQSHLGCTKPLPAPTDQIIPPKGHAETRIPAFDGKTLSLRLELCSIRDGFREFYEKRIGAILGHVFRLQSTILAYIDTSFDAARDDDKELQTQLVRLYNAQLSDPEMHLLLYYGLSHFADGTDLKHLLTKYRVFDALLDKGPEYIWHRIPEISYFEQEPANNDSNQRS